MKNTTKFLLALIVPLFFAGCKDHDFYDVITQENLPLSGIQENPANTSPATGTANVTYDKVSKKLTYTVSYSNLSGNPVAGHIHGTAPRGANAGVQHGFTNLPAATSGTFTGTADVDGVKIKEEDLLNGLYYINIHTPAFPGGEIRGQIEFYDQSYIVSKKGLPLSGAQEVPAVSTGATGSVDVTYNKKTKRLSYMVSWSGLSAPLTGSHIHGEAGRGANAAVRHNFTDLSPKTTSGAVSNSVVVDEVSIKEADLLNGRYYFNIHSSSFPSGEIRGQVEF